MAQDDMVWLKDFMQDDLYLVAEDGNTSAEVINTSPKKETPDITFNCLGPVNSGFLILANYPDEEHIPTVHLQSLENILARKDIISGDFTVLNISGNEVADYDAIISHFSPKKIVMMGNDAVPQGFAANSVNTITDDAGIKIFTTDSFADLLLSKDKKRAFWAEMKNF